MDNTSDIFADDFSSRDELNDHLEKNSDVFRDSLIKNAFQMVDRKDFVTRDYKIEAYEDYPLPIGSGQTISQPTTVAFMLELLSLKRGDNVLDIGAGSGYTTALLASIVGEKGKVTGIEIYDDLVKFGQENLAKYSFPWAHIELGVRGIPDHMDAPFDKILVSAGMSEVSDELLDQLKPGGVLVAPIDDSKGGYAITKVEKPMTEKGRPKITSYPGFAFVPFQD